MKLVLMVSALTIGACVGNGPFGIPIAGDSYDGPTPPMPGQSLAEAVVWRSAFQSPSWNSPPPVVWLIDTTCTNQDGTHQGSFDNEGTCVDGIYDRWRDVAFVAWKGSFAASAYAHELCHALLVYAQKDQDPNHQSSCFKGTDGSFDGPGSLVGIATAALVEMGL